MCPNPPAQPKRTANLAHLSLNRASNSNSSAFVSVDTQLKHVVAPRTLRWLPDTGSDVDPIGLRHLSALGGNLADLTRDPDTVCTADGRSLTSLGRFRATLFMTTTHHTPTVHVYDGLTDALLSRTSLAAMGYLPEGWPQQIRRTTSDRDPPPAEVERVLAELLEEFSDVLNEDGELPPMNGVPWTSLSPKMPSRTVSTVPDPSLLPTVPRLFLFRVSAQTCSLARDINIWRKTTD